MTTLRASKAPRFLACPGSMKHPDDTGSGPEAAMGSLEHKWVKHHLKDDVLPDLAGYDDDSDERMLWNMWLQMHRELVDPLITSAREMGAELLIEGHLLCAIDDAGIIGSLTGHPDLLIIITIDGKRYGLIFDWKTGRVESHLALDQLRAYATLAVANYGAFEHIDIYACYMRSGNYDHRRLTMPDIAEFGERIKYAGNNPDRLCAGEQCQYCPGATQCPATQETMAMIARIEDPAATVAEMSPGKVIELYGQMKAVKGVIKKIEDAFKSVVYNYGGRVEGPDGKALVSTVIRTNRELVGPRVAEVLLAWMDEDDLGSCMKASLSKAEKIVSSKVERGQKGKEAKALVEDLDEAGAIKRTEVHGLKIEAMPKQIEEK